MKKFKIKTARNVETVHTHTHTHTGSLSVKNKINKNITIFLLFTIFIILNTGKSKAVLQANGNTGATYNLSDWMINVRKMESLGGAMGLTETLNSNLTSSSDSNNIDVHMEKNTEYGALVILSASSYGNPNKIASGETTTGNATGVVMKLNREWVSASGNDSQSTNFKVAAERYKNAYTTTYVAKTGDAITETAGWHGSTSSIWMNRTSTGALVRSYSGSIFSYFGKSYESEEANSRNKKYSSRAVVVSGQGL